MFFSVINQDTWREVVIPEGLRKCSLRGNKNDLSF